MDQKTGYNARLIFTANVAELVDALDLGSSGVSRESSSLSIRTISVLSNTTILYFVEISKTPV